ncbi:heavy metal translocating P-type ATPase [Lentilactobacillus senioris]|uniref:heavy metal translocating P-type ATPase n=1 Tax=Lentilactobacillus senioris TaxID=931534 RepID=UPI002280639A|nr:heavy metal translocating P-type ATPase [Lentilactobacillus senioris]MCY9806188.1 heavy metal translocating P-type ATPase [Lentilactobacillus senioris]
MQKFSDYKRLWWVLGIGIAALILMFGFHQPQAAQILVTVLGSILALLMFIDMIQTLRQGNFGVDLLAITAIIATLAVGEFWAALIVLLMLTGGDALEDYAANKANAELHDLVANSPRVAHRLEANEQVVDIDVDAVQIGDRLTVRPGEVIPVDGQLLVGETTVDESSLTGESQPVDKLAGDLVMSGAVNGDNAITLLATKTAADSQYQSIVKLVQEANSQPAHFVRMADRYAVPFTLTAYVIAGAAWWLSGDPIRFAQVLVVASPCPLILAAPIAFVSGMSRASRNGIVIKNGSVIEKTAALKSLGFDKTGTITKGHLTIDQINSETGWSPEELLSLAAGVEQHSGHILARSLVSAAGENIPPATNVQEVTAQGVSATINNQVVKVGKASFVAADAPQVDTTSVFVSVNGNYAGYITFTDELRPEGPKVMAELHELGIHNLMMISGDRRAIAEQIAAEVGIDQVFAPKLPAEKIAVLKTTPKDLRPVGMVGDGVNDAPSLATADVGFAMGAYGATAASESADVVIMKDNLGLVPAAIKIAKDTMLIAKEAVLIGIAICTILMLIAATGVIPTIIGALFQEVVDTVTILYALRARGIRKKL